MLGDQALVVGDRGRLDQALTNLVENAVKYSTAGSDVTVTVWRGDGEAGLTVIDRGPGIPRDLLPRIFERFFRVDRSRSRAAGGSGLGLAICTEIMRAHGGRAWAESEAGHGSRFSLALPSLSREQTLTEPSPSRSAVSP